jgi:hypothetical protein
MVDRISIFQAMLAAVYSCPFISAALMVASQGEAVLNEPRRHLLPWFGTSVLLCVPGVLANVIAWILIALVGGGLSGRNRHLAMGLIGGLLIIAFVDIVARAFRAMGGGPLDATDYLALVVGAACNVLMVLAVWRLGLKSNYD